VSRNELFFINSKIPFYLSAPPQKKKRDLLEMCLVVDKERKERIVERVERSVRLVWVARGLPQLPTHLENELGPFVADLLVDSRSG